MQRRGFWLNFAVSPFVRWTTVIAEFREACHRREEGDESLVQGRLGDAIDAELHRESGTDE